jgi:hypothetical protein
MVAQRRASLNGDLSKRLVRHSPKPTNWEHLAWRFEPTLLLKPHGTRRI